MMCQTLYGVCVCLNDVRGFAFQMKNASIQNRLYVATDARVLGWSRLLACAHAHSHTESVLLDFVRFMAKILFKKNQMKSDSQHIYAKKDLERKLCRKFVIDFYLHFAMFSFWVPCSHVCFVRSFVRLGFDVDDKTHWWICFVGFVAHKLIVCPPNTLQHSVSSDN